MKTNKQQSRSNGLNTNKMRSLNKEELKKINGGGWVLKQYVENGTIIYEYVYEE